MAEFDGKIVVPRGSGVQAMSGEGVTVTRRYRHKSRGTVYTLIGVGHAQGTMVDEDAVVLYRGDDGKLWCRPQAEFNDGRFEEIAPAPTAGDELVERLVRYANNAEDHGYDYLFVADLNAAADRLRQQ